MLGMLKKYTVELCPDVNGRLTHNGLPLPNQTVIRSLTYNDNEIVDKCITDLDGTFQFPRKSIKSRLPGNIFHEISIRQILFTEFQSQELFIWLAYQRETDTPDTFIELMKSLDAELTNDEQVYEFENIEFPVLPFLIKTVCLLK